jgi:putative transposase
MDEHLGYEKHDMQNKRTTNSRNGKSEKNIVSEYGEQEIAVPVTGKVNLSPLW